MTRVAGVLPVPGCIGLRRWKLSGSSVAAIFALSEQVDTELVHLRTVNLDDFDLQLHLPDVWRPYDQRIDNDFRVQSGQLGRRVGRRIAQRRAGERNAIQLGFHLDVVIGERLAHFLLQAGYIQVGENQISGRLASLIPQNQAAHAGSLSRNHDLRGARGERIDSQRIAHIHAFEPAHAFDKSRPAHQHVQRLARRSRRAGQRGGGIRQGRDVHSSHIAGRGGRCWWNAGWALRLNGSTKQDRREDAKCSSQANIHEHRSARLSESH